VALDWRNHTGITIVITAVAIAAIVSDTIIAGGAIVTVDSIVGVPAVVFIGRPGTQETSCRRVFLGRLVVILLFRGGVMPFPRHIAVIVFIFQFPIEEELEVLAVDQGLIIL
jgi:hydrogenase maturation factor HypE